MDYIIIWIGPAGEFQKYLRKKFVQLWQRFELRQKIRRALMLQKTLLINSRHQMPCSHKRFLKNSLVFSVNKAFDAENFTIKFLEVLVLF